VVLQVVRRKLGERVPVEGRSRSCCHRRG
jgi:hypothetical protein